LQLVDELAFQSGHLWDFAGRTPEGMADLMWYRTGGKSAGVPHIPDSPAGRDVRSSIRQAPHRVQPRFLAVIATFQQSMRLPGRNNRDNQVHRKKPEFVAVIDRFFDGRNP